MSKKFYVYEHWRPDTDVCFYVGKGKNNRAYIFTRNKHYNRIVMKLARTCMCVEVRLVQSKLSEKKAFVIECERIAFWRASGVKLTNYTDGGEGASGAVISKATRKKLSDAMKNRFFSKEHRKRISAGLMGRVISAETKALWSKQRKGVSLGPRPKAVREKIRQALLGHSVSEETRKKISDKNLGQYVSPETRKKLSVSGMGRVVSSDTRKKISAARNGIVLSPETREKIRKKALERSAKKRARLESAPT